MGVASLITAVAPAVGPSYGGAVMELAGWRMVFLCLLPVTVLSLGIGSACVRQATRVDVGARFDLVGFVLLGASFFALIYGINAASYEGASPMVLAVFAAFAVALGVFVAHARACEHPLIDMRLFSFPAFSASAAVIAAVSFAILGFAYLIPNYAQLALGASASLSGTPMLPGCALVAVFAPLGGRLLDRAGARLPIIAGMACLVASVVLYVTFSSALTPFMLGGFYVLFGDWPGLGFQHNDDEWLGRAARVDSHRRQLGFQYLPAARWFYRRERGHSGRGRRSKGPRRTFVPPRWREAIGRWCCCSCPSWPLPPCAACSCCSCFPEGTCLAGRLPSAWRYQAGSVSHSGTGPF